MVQFPFVNEKGVYHYPDRLMNEMEQHVVSRICGGCRRRDLPVEE